MGVRFPPRAQVGKWQVVYIFSRIRKLIEIDGVKKEYKVLKFYCDWALHAEIEDMDAVKDIIDRILAGDKETIMHFVLAFNGFHRAFIKFLAAYKCTHSIYDKPFTTHAFNKLLSQIYTDTPLIIKTTQKTKIIWKGIADESTSNYGGSIKVEKIL